MKIIVVGCGRLGAELAYRLYQRGHSVAVIDQVDTAFNNLNPDFHGHLVEGEALSQEVLLRAGIESADGLAVVTNSDSLNAVVAHIARSVYNITNIVVRNYDPNHRSLHEIFNLQVISSSSWGAQRIEELIYHREIRTVFSAGNGEVEIYEFSVPPFWEGQSIKETISEHQCCLVALSRSGVAMIPDEDFRLAAGDIVLVSATLSGIQDLRKHLALPQEK